MILRSVTKHVREQNWFAVFIDLIIVVFGVFIGIQVSNWNEQLAGEKQADILMDRIVADVENDILSINAELNYLAVVRNYAMTAVAALNDENTVSDEQFVIGAYQATQMNNAWSNRATYNEMVSTGQINLIQDEELKAKIFGYFAVDFAAVPQVLKIAPYREYMRGHMPVAIQDAIKAQCGDNIVEVANAWTSVLTPTCDLDFPDVELQQAAILLRSLPEMLFNLQFQIAVNDTKVFNFEQFVLESEKLLKALNEHQP